MWRMSIGEIIQIVFDCVSAIIAILSGHHIIKLHKKTKKPKKDKDKDK
jgi:hypothetical protein